MEILSKLRLKLSKLGIYNIKDYGKNNKVEIHKPIFFRKSKIKIYGNNNKIVIKENAYLHNVTIRIGFPDCPINNCNITIGSRTGFNSADIQLGESGSFLTIGDDCMFSFNVEIACTDTHSITDLDGNLLNVGKSIEIGSHVWGCKEIKILKNTKIPDNCIIAQNSIVTKKFEKQNCVIAGNPARVVKENTNWHRERPERYRTKNENNTNYN